MKKALSIILSLLFSAALCVAASADTSYDRLFINEITVNGNDVKGSYVEITQGDRLYVLGWAVNAKTQSKLKEAFYTVDGKEYKCADNYRDREDVAKALNLDPSLGVHAGIGQNTEACELLGINELQAGQYNIVIKARYEDGTVENIVGADFTLNVLPKKTGDEKMTYKELAEMKLTAYKNGASYAFYGLAKFDLDKPYVTGDAQEYEAFTKYYGYTVDSLKKNSVSLYDEKTGVTVYGASMDDLTDEVIGLYAERFALYEDVVYGSEKRDYSDFAGTLPSKYNSAPYEDRMVGVAYSTWMYKDANRFKNTWETPLIGNYTSLDDPDALKAHASLLYDAGVDFVFVDWSNDVDYDFYSKKDYKNGSARNDFETIELGTTQMFECWSTLEHSPKISIFIGCPDDASAITDGRLQKKADQVYREYIENPTYKELYQTYLGKPLLIVYLGTPALAQSGLEKLWNDDRFTVRFLTGYIGQQSMYNESTRAATQPIWSWEERGQQCYAVNNKTVECMTVQSAWRSQGKEGDKNYIAASGRKNGDTFLKMWVRAKAFGPQIVLCPTWNEFSKGEQPTAEINKDLEPSNECGTLYYDILKEQIKLFKNLKSEQTAPVTEQTEQVTAAPETTAPDNTDTSAIGDTTTVGGDSAVETDPGKQKQSGGSTLKAVLYTAAAVILAAAIAIGATIFRSKKNEKRHKK